MRSVSIILKTWNALPHVRLCVPTLLRHTDGPFELIVIDNGSRPDTIGFLREVARADRRVRLVENGENRGPGAANRQGAALAEGELLCLMDSDVLTPKGWLARLAAEFERHEDVQLLAPLMYHPTLPHPFDEANSMDAWFRVKREHPRLAPLGQFYAYSRGLSVDEFEELVCQTEGQQSLSICALQACPPDFIGTACALVDREFVAAIGGVADPRFAGYGSEDVDLCWRIGEAGGQVARSASVYVHHFHHASLDDNAADAAEALRAANLILYEKWRERLIELVSGIPTHRGEVTPPLQSTTGQLRAYLERHFIFGPLARHTTFLADLAAATGLTDLPEEIIWRP